MAGFTDRFDAGKRLAQSLGQYREGNAIVLGLARGGVAVGYAVAQELQSPLRSLIVRKVGAPQNPELAIGAVSEVGVRWLDWQLIESLKVPQSYVEEEVLRQTAESRRRRELYQEASSLDVVRGRPVIIVDDGIATGSSALVAVRSARQLAAAKVILATPLASLQAIRALEPVVDHLVALETPDPFLAVGLHYGSFHQLSDTEVIRLLTEISHSESAQE